MGTAARYLEKRMEDLSEKPCRCGETMGEVIGFDDRVTDGEKIPVRRSWWCQECNAVEECVGRERVITNWPRKK
jgi:hypothetical protein